MSGTERIVYEDIGEGSKILGECFAVLGLFCAIAGVLKKNNIAVLHRSDSCLCVLADDAVISRELDFLAEKLGEADSNRSEGEFRLRNALRLAEVAAKDDLAAVGNQLLDGRKSGNETVFVCDLASFQRNVEIAAAEDAKALYIDIINRFLVKHWYQSSFLMDLIKLRKGPVLLTGPFLRSYES